jgi:hypothetical protein
MAARQPYSANRVLLAHATPLLHVAEDASHKRITDTEAALLLQATMPCRHIILRFDHAIDLRLSRDENAPRFFSIHVPLPRNFTPMIRTDMTDDEKSAVKTTPYNNGLSSNDHMSLIARLKKKLSAGSNLTVQMRAKKPGDSKESISSYTLINGAFREVTPSFIPAIIRTAKTRHCLLPVQACDVLFTKDEQTHYQITGRCKNIKLEEISVAINALKPDEIFTIFSDLDDTLLACEHAFEAHARYKRFCELTSRCFSPGSDVATPINLPLLKIYKHQLKKANQVTHKKSSTLVLLTSRQGHFRTNTDDATSMASIYDALAKASSEFRSSLMERTEQISGRYHTKNLCTKIERIHQYYTEGAGRGQTGVAVLYDDNSLETQPSTKHKAFIEALNALEIKLIIVPLSKQGKLSKKQQQTFKPTLCSHRNLAHRVFSNSKPATRITHTTKTRVLHPSPQLS